MDLAVTPALFLFAELTLLHQWSRCAHARCPCSMASVVKPELRASLAGNATWALVASIGDQVSDFTGPYAAAAAFKLPNPTYLVI